MKFEEQNIINACATAVNMFDGMNMSGNWERWDAVTEAWGQGFVELSMRIGEYAIFSEKYLGLLNQQDFPGVYDYEVSTAFGKWFADYIVEHADDPTREEAEFKLMTLADAFFDQGRTKTYQVTVEKITKLVITCDAHSLEEAAMIARNNTHVCLVGTSEYKFGTPEELK